MNYAVTLLKNGLKDVQLTYNYLFACNWKQTPNHELIKVDYQIHQIKNAIQFLKTNTRRTDIEIFRELAHIHNVGVETVRKTVNEPKKFGI